MSNLHCVRDARISRVGSADGAREQSHLAPFRAPPHRRGLAGLKQKQMFSSFLDLARDLQFSNVQTEPRVVRFLHPPQNKTFFLKRAGDTRPLFSTRGCVLKAAPTSRQCPASQAWNYNWEVVLFQRRP